MKRFILLTFVMLGAFAQEDAQGSDYVAEDDPYRVDLRIENLNQLYKDMGPNEIKKVDLADESYFTLSMPHVKKLLVTVMLYNPADETHNKAYEAEYIWNEDLGTLIAETCAEYEPPVLPPTVEPFCVEGIMKASEMISLQVSGIADYEGWDMENLEKCIADKLPPKTIEKPYLKCLINVIGDKKYAQEAIDAKIKEMEAQGYECEPNGDCVKAEDPEIFAKILEELRGEKVPIDVPNDDRPRFCDLETIPIIGENPNEPGTEYIETHQYSCSYWVNHVYCKTINDRLYWAVEYVDNKGHTETFHTYPFNVATADTTVSVPWAEGIRMSKLDLAMQPGNLAVEQLTFSFNKSKLPVTCQNTGSSYKGPFQHGVAELSGELAGFHFARIAEGVRVKSVIHRN